jgi:hypothetical protein
VQTGIQRWGDSLGLRIPRSFAHEAGEAADVPIGRRAHADRAWPTTKLSEVLGSEMPTASGVAAVFRFSVSLQRRRCCTRHSARHRASGCCSWTCVT